MDEGMVLGRFIDSLLRGWRIIVLAVVVCVAGAAAYTFTQPTRYSARVLVATVRASTRVSLGTGIVALSEDDLAKASASAKERLQSFVVFVNNPEVAEEVLAELGDRLPADLRNTKRLLRMVRGNLASGSDTIEIIVTTREPQTAAMVANAWSRAYVRQINTLYEGLEESMLGVVDDEVASAEAVYKQRQSDVEAFLAADRRDELQRVISDTTYMLRSLAEISRSATVGALAYQQAAYQGTVAKLAEAQQAQLSGLVGALDEAEALLRDAQDMRAQVSQGGEAAARSSEVALILLKARAFAQQPSAGQVLPSNSLVLQPGSGDVSVAAVVADLEALVSTLEARRVALRQEITLLAEALMRGDGWQLLDVDATLLPVGSGASADSEASAVLEQSIAEHQATLNAARTELAQEVRRLLDLESQRDLAWQSYDALLRRQAEMAISDQTTGARVRLAVPAVVPEASSRDVLLNLGLAALAGLLVGLVAAWVVSFWSGYRARAAGQSPTTGAAA